MDYFDLTAVLREQGGSLQLRDDGNLHIERWNVNGRELLILIDGEDAQIFDATPTGPDLLLEYLAVRHRRLTRHRIDPDNTIDRREFYDAFIEAYNATVGLTYRFQKGPDNSQFGILYQSLEDTDTPLTFERWKTAVQNYFASKRTKYTIADLANSFDTFFVSAIDRFNKPVQNGINVRKHAQNRPDDVRPAGDADTVHREGWYNNKLR